MICNIIWDVDGTLFDTYPAIARAFKAAIQQLGKDAALEWIEELSKSSLGDCVAKLSSEYQLEIGDIERALKGAYAQTAARESPPFEGVKELCKYIKSIGGKNVIITHRGRDGTLELLSVHQMIADFDGAITRDDGYPRKPDPTAFHAAMERYCLGVENTINIGDREIDIAAGQSAGIFSCLYASKPSSVQPDLVVDHYEALHRYIKEKNREK